MPVPLILTGLPGGALGAMVVVMALMFVMGFFLEYLRGVAPPEVTTLQIYKGVVPFVAIQLLTLVLLALFPAMATWLPGVVFG